MPSPALRSRYDNVQVVLHWITVLLVLFQFFSSLLWPQFHRPTRHLLVNWHMTFGIVLGAVVIARLVWRFLPGNRVAPAVGGIEERLATVVHYALYALLVLQFGLGLVLRWSGRRRCGSSA
jgi:cytochrome b561